MTATARFTADGGCTCHYCRYLSDPDRDAELESIPDACRAMGGVSHMFVVRRIADPRFKFPEIIRLGRGSSSASATANFGCTHRTRG